MKYKLEPLSGMLPNIIVFPYTPVLLLVIETSDGFKMAS
jgi:hypothetical protein